jgi:predicted RecA/RadA family phage recombinase
MKTLVQDGRIIEVTAPYVAPAGQGVLIGHLFGVAVADIANGAKGDILTQGVVEIAKTSALACSGMTRTRS